MEDDETSQNEEIEALVSIYDDSLTLLPSSSGKAFEIKLDVNGATLRLNFPPDYPSISSVWVFSLRKFEGQNDLFNYLYLSLT